MNTPWLIIFQRAHYCGLALQEAFDLALAASSLGQTVSLAFMNDSQRLLNPGYDHSIQGGRQLQKHLGALHLYGIERLYRVTTTKISTQATSATSITSDAKNSFIERVTKEDLAKLIQQHSIVITL